MSNETQVTVRGFVGKTPTLLISPRGTKYTRFRLGTTPRVRDAATGEWRDGATDWFTVKVWKDFAENVATSLEKGTPVIVRGNLAVDTWTSDGQERTTVVIAADSVGIELNTGTAHFTKVVRGARFDESGGARPPLTEDPLPHGLDVPDDAATLEPGPDDDLSWEREPDPEPGGYGESRAEQMEDATAT